MFKVKRQFKVLIVSLLGISFNFSSVATAADTTFYMDLKKGCYSYTSNGKGLYLIDSSNYKNLFKSKCKNSHHLEVFWVGKVNPSDGSKQPSQNDAGRICNSKYEKVFGYSAPTDISNFKPYLRWFFSDPGSENKKYGPKIICLIHKADTTYTNYIPIKGTLLGS